MIDVATFESAAFPADERFIRWRDCVCKLVGPLKITSEYADDFHATSRLLPLGPVQVWPMTIPPTRFERTPKLIRRDSPDLYHVSLILDGTYDVTQAGTRGQQPVRSLCLVDTSRPFDCRTDGGRQLSGIGVEIPKSLLPVPEREVDRLLGRGLPTGDGISALLVDFLTGVTARSHSYRPDDGPRLGAVMVDLLAAFVAHTLDAEWALPPENHRHALVLRIRSYVHQHLHEPSLTVAGIARAHHISVSYLHRLFQEEELTVSAWIRDQRLERARRDLADPALRAVPISEIAARWGFTHPAAFSRTFRAAVGVPPSDYRHRAAVSPAEGGVGPS